MGALTTIVVLDAASTPVSHTFQPQRADGTSSLFLEQSNGSSIGYWPLTVGLVGPKAGQAERFSRFTLNLAIPVVANADLNGVSVPQLQYTSRVNLEIKLPEQCTLQNRKDLRKILVGILNDASIVSMIEQQQNLY